jgi:excisionase family DNA binding protein
MAYSLTQAAEAAKVQRSTVFKWIKAGKVSATKADDGTFRIEPAELHRFLDSVAKEPTSPATAKQAEAAQGAGSDTAIELVSVRSQLDALKQILDMERERARELREDRDAWKHQAERLAIAPPLTTAPVGEVPGGWWPFRRRA